MSDDRVPAEWLRGSLTLCVLAVLAQGETHGYAIAQSLRHAGVGEIKGGTLYPILNRLETDGSVTSTWREGTAGPGRKVFSITDAGRTRLADLAARWEQFTAATTTLLTGATISTDEPTATR